MKVLCWEKVKIGLKRRQKIALFGGTFDPPHLAHRQLLDEVQSLYHFQKIIVIPSKFPPGKMAEADYEKRLEWTKRVFAIAPYEVSHLEEGNSQTLFAREIFYQLRLLSPEAEYYWILGEDQWEQLQFWKNIDEYATRLIWLPLPRQNAPEAPIDRLLSRRLPHSSCRYHMAKIGRQPEVSSTEIRESIRKGSGPALEWIPKSIKDDVIENYRLKKGA